MPRPRILFTSFSPKFSFGIDIKNGGPVGLKVEEKRWLSGSGRNSRRRLASRVDLVCYRGRRCRGGEENCRAGRSRNLGRCSW